MRISIQVLKDQFKLIEPLVYVNSDMISTEVFLSVYKELLETCPYGEIYLNQDNVVQLDDFRRGGGNVS